MTPDNPRIVPVLMKRGQAAGDEGEYASTMAENLPHASRAGTVASSYGTWQSAAMATPAPKSPASGGFPIALGIMGGAGVGFALGEATIGLLVGLALGIAVAVVIWRRGSR
jgi:hypothetical protein